MTSFSSRHWVSWAFKRKAVIWDDPDTNWARFDQVVIRSCWGYELRLAEFLAWIAVLGSRHAMLQNSDPVVRWNADKCYLRQVEGTPETYWLEEGVDVPRPYERMLRR